MPSVNYYNRSAPFWDFIAGLEEQGSNHPMFATRGDTFDNTNNNNDNQNSNNNNNEWNPWTQGWAGMPFGPFAHRGRHDHHGPPPGARGPWGQSSSEQQEAQPENEKEGEAGSSQQSGPPPSFSEQPQEGGPGPHHGSGSTRGRKSCGGRAGYPGWGSRGRGHHHGPPRGMPPMMGGFGNIAQMFQEQLFGEEGTTKDKGGEDFKPEIDVFDTSDSYVVHVSLPGAKKEDVGVNWDAEKSELSIAGVSYRPADEELLKSLAMDERKVGAFERKVRLGSRANPAQVDVDAITARMEDGVLRVDVPKLDSGYVEIKKVDIE